MILVRQLSGAGSHHLGTNWPHNQATTTDSYPEDCALLDRVLGWSVPG